MTDPMTPERLAEIEARLTVSRLGRSYAMETDADLRGIRDLAAEVRRLQAAVERVRALHQDEGQSQGYFPGDRGYGERDHCCGTCGEYGEYGVEWPCPTVDALDGDEQ